MFEIHEEEFGQEPAIRLTDAIHHRECVILSRGALLNEFLVGEGRLPIIDGYRPDTIDQLSTSFRSAWLVPFPNRVDRGKFTFQGVTYALAKNFPHENNAIHGLIYDRFFDFLDFKKSADSCSITTSNHFPGTSQFPFSFVTHVGYCLTETGLEVTTEITNRSEKPMPLGVGWHPYFKTGGSINQLKMTMPTGYRLMLGDRGIPTGLDAFYNEFVKSRMIEHQTFDDCFRVTGDRPETVLLDEEHCLEIRVWQDGLAHGYQYLQVYTPDTRDCVAIEPMTGAPDAFNNKLGLVTLASDDKFSVRCGISTKFI